MPDCCSDDDDGGGGVGVLCGDGDGGGGDGDGGDGEAHHHHHHHRSYPRIRHDGDGANDGYDANDQIGPANHLKHCKDCKDCPVSLSDCHVTFIDVMIFSFCERFSSVSQNH